MVPVPRPLTAVTLSLPSSPVVPKVLVWALAVYWLVVELPVMVSGAGFTVRLPVLNFASV